ncbi:MAG: hypothetical protein JWM87_739 [Candidatus Eremiobacteraeota bacterium]|nr:hypothetical protein [Candidatus Eremiobacteraeota bacterium]
MPNAVAQATSIGYTKEITFGTFAVPTIFPNYETWSPSPKNIAIKRPTTRRRAGQSMPATGGYEFSASLRVGAEPDTLFPLLAYFFGSQTTPSAYIYAVTALTSGTAVASNVSLPVTAGTGTKFQNGDSVIVGAGTANVETCVINAIPTANAIQVAATTKTHLTADTVQGLSPTAYGSTLSLALSTIPSFSLEYNRVNDAIDYVGCKLDTLKISIAPGQQLMCDFGLVAANEVINVSPTTPSFSTLFPLVSEANINGAASVNYNGVNLTAANTTLVRKFDLQVNNNLDKGFRTAASRFVQDFPLGQRTGSGSIVLSFPDNTKYKDFLGLSTATGPQGSIAGVQLNYAISTQSLIDPTRLVAYSVNFTMPNLFLNGDAVPGKLSGALEQTLSFDLAETSGANNDVQALIVGGSAVVY